MTRSKSCRAHLERIAGQWPTYDYRRVTAQLRREGVSANVAPALIARELAETVHARLAWNREHAAALVSSAASRGQYDYRPLLAGGFAICGGCGGAISVNHLPSTTVAGKIRHRYTCRRLRVKGACTPRTVECGRLDGAVWRAITLFLQDHEWMAAEVERLRELPDPGAFAIAGIDRQLAELDTRIANKRRYAERVNDDRERAVVAGEVIELWRQRDGLEQQCSAAEAHYQNWRAQRDGLQSTLEWCEVVGANMDAADNDMRCLILAALHVRVYVERTNESPRVRLYASSWPRRSLACGKSPSRWTDMTYNLIT